MAEQTTAKIEYGCSVARSGIDAKRLSLCMILALILLEAQPFATTVLADGEALLVCQLGNKEA